MATTTQFATEMPLSHTPLRLSCQQQRILVLNQLVGIKRRLTLLRVRNRSLQPPASGDVIRARMTFRSKYFFAVFATLISIKSVTSGVACPLSIHAFPDMRSSVVSPRSAPQSPSSNPATLLQSAAWLVSCW